MKTEGVWVVVEGSYLDPGVVIRSVHKTLEGARRSLVQRVSEPYGYSWTKVGEDRFSYGRFYLMIEAYDLSP